jgi:transglutaminase-like putative cysteine protease
MPPSQRRWEYAEERIGRCGEWAILFGAILTALKIQARISHDFLNHVWNEALLQEKWVHIDSTLAYPVSLNHPYYYEQNWGKSTSMSWHFQKMEVWKMLHQDIHSLGKLFCREEKVDYHT